MLNFAMTKQNNNPLNLAATVIRQKIMKFYTYKNGEIAFFENNERMLISKEEKEMLVTGTEPFAGESIYSVVYDYIYLKIGERFSKTAFSKVLAEYRNNFYTKESKTANVKGHDFNVEVYRENNEPIAFRVIANNQERTAVKGLSGFDKAMSDFKALNLI